VELFTTNKWTVYHDLNVNYVGLDMLTDMIMWEMKISEAKKLNLFWLTPDNIPELITDDEEFFTMWNRDEYQDDGYVHLYFSISDKVLRS
ncbi:hypothetical protein MKW92_043803, partial [Papaver armeniacum]